MKLVSVLGFCLLLFFSKIASAQVNVVTTNSFTVEGKLQKSFTFSLTALDSFTVQSIGDVNTYNHLGELKDRKKAVKGILLKDILAKAAIVTAKPKDLSSYYFVLTATDGYKAVLSYNEVFGNGNIYVMTENNGKKLLQQDDRIAVLIITAPGKGHVYVKGIKSITVAQAN